MFGLLVKVEEKNLRRQIAQNVKVFPIYGRPPRFLHPEKTMVFFYVPNKGIEAYAIYTGSRWLNPQDKGELDRYRTYEEEGEWNDWVTRGKGKVRGVIFYKDLKPATIPWNDAKRIIRFYGADLQQAYLPLDEEITSELITQLRS